MSDLYKLMEGAIEFHVHFDPDGLTSRKNDAFELVREAQGIGIRAVVLKNKSCGTGAIARLSNKYSEGAQAIGGLTLDVSVGGLNPAAVEIEAALGSKIVWMPTYSALNDPTHKKTEKDKNRNTLSVIDHEGNLLPEVLEILEVIRDKEMILASGHISRKEIFILMPAAKDMGIKKLVINHPLTSSVGTRLDIADQRALAEMGVYMDHCWVASMPKHNHLAHSEFLHAIREVGADRCIMSTDFGQIHNPSPAEGFEMMLRGLIEQGIGSEDIEKMIKHNPAHLLDI
jgi:hypothetical protein